MSLVELLLVMLLFGLFTGGLCVSSNLLHMLAVIVLAVLILRLLNIPGRP